MFEVYPGFERVTLRAKIEWLGRVRPVAVRFEQWPLDEFLILGVLRFEDEIDGGEWVIINHLGAGFFSSSRLRGERIKRKWAKQIIAITEAFLHKQRFKQLGLLLKIPLPRHPQYVVSVPDMAWIPTRRRAAFVGNYWLDSMTPYEDFGMMCSFCLYESFESAISPFQQSASEVRAALMEEWNDTESDAYFA